MKNVKIAVFFVASFILGFLFIKKIELARAESKPDIFVSKIKTTVFGSKATRIVNEDMTLEVTVVNRGKAKAKDSAVSFYIIKGKSKKNVLPKTTQIDLYVPPLSPHKSETVRRGWKPTKPGSYKIKVCADSQNNILESNEDNNCLTKKITIRGRLKTKVQSGQKKPDLIVDNIYTYNDLQNDRFSLGVGMTNWDGVACPGTFRVTLKGIDQNGNVHDGISFNTDDSFVDVRFFNPLNNSCLATAQSLDFFFRNVPASEIVTLKTDLDVNNEVPENNEKNNKQTLPGKFINKNYWYKSKFSLRK